MPVNFIVLAHGPTDPATGLPERRVTVVAQDNGSVGPAGTGTANRRKCLRFIVSGASGKQSRFKIDLPDSGRQIGWKGDTYPFGPKDRVYIIDDPASEMNGDLVFEDGSLVPMEFSPTDVFGDPE